MVNLGDKEKLKAYLLEKSTKVGDCLRFTGGHISDGYGVIIIDGRKWGVHRLAAYIFHDLDLNDSNLMALHKPECRFKDCWDELHIYVGTYSDNMKDAVVTKTHSNTRKTHCPAGHPYDEENTRIIQGTSHRQCKICNRIKSAARGRRNRRLKTAQKSRQHDT